MAFQFLSSLRARLLILQRLKPLEKFVQHKKNGQMGSRAKMDSGRDEINQLASAFEKMSVYLESREHERRQAEVTLRESERRYWQLANLLPGIVFEADEKGNITFASKKAFEIMGYSPQDIEKGVNVFQFNLSSEFERAQEVFREALKEEKNNLSFTLQRKDGSTFPALIHTSPIFKDGKPAGLRGIAFDITDLKQIEESLRRSEDTAKRLAQETEIIAEIGRIISATPNIEEIYEKFAQEVKKLIIFDRIAINIINPIDKVFSIAYSWGPTVLGREMGKIIPLAGTGVEWVINNKKSLLVSEENREEIMNQCPGLWPVFQRGFRSLILSPLFSRDQVIGIFNIQAFALNAYGENELRIAERVSDQIAGAIANVLLFEEQSRTAENLKKSEEEAKNLARENAVLAEIGRIISSTLDIEEVYEGFAREVKKLIPFDRISINIVDFEKNTVTLAYTTGESVPGREAKDVFPLAGSFTEEVIKRKQGMVFNPANEEEASRFPGLLPVYHAGLHSIMMVPLINRDQAIATLNFMAEAPNFYSEQHIQLANRVGNQIGGAVANALLYEAYRKTFAALRKSEEEARHLAKENEIVANIGRIVSSSLEIDKIYDLFAQEVHKVIPFNRLVVTIIDHEKGVFYNDYIAGIQIPGRGPEDVVALEGSFTEEVMRQKKGILLQPEDGKELIRRFPKLAPVWERGFRSLMGIPLISQDKVIGVLHIYSLIPNFYEKKQLDLGERIGHQISGAIANAILFAKHQRLEKERASIEEQFRQAQKMEAVGRLAGGIAHDFNNSLTLIKVSAQLALMELKDGDPLRDKINTIVEATDRSANLARQLLAFSRKQVMEMKVIDLNALIKDLDKMLHRVIGEDIELIYELAEDLKKVKVDPGQIEQVILNLTLNSRDAMPQGGRLIIKTANAELDENYARTHLGAKVGQYVMLSVTDTGIGMTREVKEHLFEPFFTTKEKGKGTGLGLSTVYGIVKQSNGYIWVYSEPGQGTTFKIYLPAQDEPAEELKRREEQGMIPKGSETILVVEDDEEVRRLARMVLERQGYKLLSASCAGEALDICAKYKEPIHLLLTDVIMPGMSGQDLAEDISILCPGIKIIYMSGYPDNIISDHGILKPGINYLPKPFTVEGLAKKVREVLNEKK